MFNISEYEKSRTLSEFILWTDAYKLAILSSDEMGKKSILRDDLFTKRMFEEAWPIRTFIKSYWPNDRNDLIVLSSGSQTYDAQIVDRDMNQIHNIEVTQALMPDDHLKRQELAEKGMYFGVFSNAEDDFNILANVINKVIDNKIKKNYPPPATLIVSLYDDVIGDQEFNFLEILSRVKFDQKQKTFKAIIFCTQNGMRHRAWGNPFNE